MVSAILNDSQGFPYEEKDGTGLKMSTNIMHLMHEKHNGNIMSVSQGECLVIFMGPNNESQNKLEINLPKWRASPLKKKEFLGGIQQTFFVNSKILNKKRPSRLKMHRLWVTYADDRFS